MNPLDMINQVITTNTNNSGIFSELNSKINNSKVSENIEDDDLNNNNNNYNINKNNSNNNIIKSNTKNVDLSYSKSKNSEDIKIDSNNNNNKNNLIYNKISKINNNNFNLNNNKENISPNFNNIYSPTIEKNENLSYNINNTTIINDNNSFYDSNKRDVKTNNNPNNYIYSTNSTRVTIGRDSNQLSKFPKNKVNQNILNDKISVNTNTTFSTVNQIPNSIIHKQKSSLLSEYAFKLNNNLDYNNNNNNFEIDGPTNEQLNKLRDWLISCDLLCYFNIFIQHNFYEIDKFINKLKTNQIKIEFKDIEDLGIKKPGHILRFFLKLQIDCGIIDNRISNYLLMNFNNTTNNTVIAMSNNDIKCCGFNCNSIIRNKNSNIINNPNYNYNDIISFLNYKGLGKFKENFIHNGFESIDYILIQMFSNFDFNDKILIEYLHIYNERERKKILKEFRKEKKKLSYDLGINYNDYDNNVEFTLNDSKNGCDICTIF